MRIKHSIFSILSPSLTSERILRAPPCTSPSARMIERMNECTNESVNERRWRERPPTFIRTVTQEMGIFPRGTWTGQEGRDRTGRTVCNNTLFAAIREMRLFSSQHQSRSESGVPSRSSAPFHLKASSAPRGPGTSLAAVFKVERGIRAREKKDLWTKQFLSSECHSCWCLGVILWGVCAGSD